MKNRAPPPEARRASCLLASRARTVELCFEFPDRYPPQLSASGNWIVPTALLLSMKQGEPLAIDAPISPVLLRNLDTIQQIYRAWIPGLKQVQVVAPCDDESPLAHGGAGLFFSRGVGSFYSLIQHPAFISELIVIHGVEFSYNAGAGAVFPEDMELAPPVSEDC